MKKIVLAEALLRRKELQSQVDRLQKINVDNLFEVKAKRINVTDSVDDITAAVPKISMQQATAAYDWHAKQLRRVDAAIQQANWSTEVELDPEAMETFVDPYVMEGKPAKEGKAA